MSQINSQNDHIHQLILDVRKLMLTSQLVWGVVVWTTVSLGMWFVLFVIDNLLHLPEGIRLAFSLGGLGLMAFEFWQFILRPLLRQERLEATTLFLERRFSIPENILINALCFESAPVKRGQEPFIRETINAGTSMIADADVKELWQFKRLRRWLTALIIICILWSIYGIAQGRGAINAFLRYINPLGDIPPAGSIVLEVTPDKDVVLAEGDDLKVSVHVKGLKGDRTLLTYPDIVSKRGAEVMSNSRGDNKATSMQLSTEGEHRYEYTFNSVAESFAFRVFAADTYSESIKVSVNRLPRIKESQFHILAPSYTGANRISTLGPPEALSGPAGSQVVIDVKLDKTADELWYKDSGDWIAFEKNGDLWTTKTTLQQADSYQIEVKAPGFDRRIKIAEGPIFIQQDQRPEVEFVTSDLNPKVNLGERLRLDIQAYDDFGAKQIYVTQKTARTDSAEETVTSWEYEGPPGQKEARESLFLSIDASRFKPGGSYVLQAHCEDFSPAGNIGASKPLMLQVRSLDEMTLSEDDPNSDAFAELDKAIQAQQTALGVTVNLMANLDDVVDANRTSAENLTSIRNHLSQMKQKQEKVGTHMTRAQDVSVEPKPEFVNKLIELRDNEHKRILERLDETGKVETIDNKTVSHSLNSVEKQQVHLLDQLLALKGIVAKKSQIEAEQAMADLLGEKEDTLTPSIEETLENTAKEVEEFIKQQKAIMEKRQMVQDKAPEDFTEEDEEMLEDLAIDQSKLAEVLDNVVNDLSNMNLLDFGDNQMTESMKSIYEKAEALADKAEEAAAMREARQDAYRLETEAVEMAEELMINCEATLGFRDNIQFVAEIPEDEQLVAPLAELPAELEDLVGDLITQEEEMRPEVEDIGSYLNSLDHTAGPVADGTISSTSAKGKTGDQRPEDNVLEGRSGAGRSGMSDGQLVESVAKDLDQNEYGLRERVSNTPLENGQVEDQDVGAATGGTGLGKTTDGTTQFGMGGKLPPKVLEMMKETLENQQNIRHSSEEVMAELDRYNLSVPELEMSIEAMKRVEESIRTADGIGIRSAYDETVNTLRKSHDAVGKHISMQYTTDDALMKKIENIISRRKSQNYKGYDQMIGAYFEALARSESPGETMQKK